MGVDFAFCKPLFACRSKSVGVTAPTQSNSGRATPGLLILTAAMLAMTSSTFTSTPVYPCGFDVRYAMEGGYRNQVRRSLRCFGRTRFRFEVCFFLCPNQADVIYHVCCPTMLPPLCWRTLCSVEHGGAVLTCSLLCAAVPVCVHL